MAVDTLGHLVTPADEQDRSQVGKLVQAVQEETCSSVEITFVDQGYTGDTAANEAGEHGVALHVVKRPEAKRGVVLLPRRWVVERSFGWAARFRHLARDDEKLQQTLAGLHYVAFAMLMLPYLTDVISMVQNML